ncbi:hypothetical protein L198_04989 [Cryptococcus wingfieldii CBS 7118]|uniref:Uncharacterized protein n=1 Tax=Cryptococcus wingfieldii CBS 7118 TaxID=1295528 RepID=A0A1E3J4F3_9TREE|nr:hypothetical protein L198_04989 [Cryptococcus wingfieldii CBS 7118]ODN94841.1 hypothetical protein L198_04989 [Cryptococcus wingfieldii CBS 7118]
MLFLREQLCIPLCYGPWSAPPEEQYDMANLSTTFVEQVIREKSQSPVFIDAARHLIDLHERGYSEEIWELWRHLRLLDRYDIPPILFFPYQNPTNDFDITLKIKLRNGGFEAEQPRHRGWQNEEESPCKKQSNKTARPPNPQETGACQDKIENSFEVAQAERQGTDIPHVISRGKIPSLSDSDKSSRKSKAPIVTTLATPDNHGFAPHGQLFCPNWSVLRCFSNSLSLAPSTSSASDSIDTAPCRDATGLVILVLVCNADLGTAIPHLSSNTKLVPAVVAGQILMNANTDNLPSSLINFAGKTASSSMILS